MLLGREAEREMLDALLEDLRGGRSRTLVIEGEAGVGKSALIDDFVSRATGCKISRIVAVQLETELPYAALHQVCAPIVDLLEALPAPQAEALQVALGQRADRTPDRFLVALAVLTLLADAAKEEPFVCIVDDAQWLDQSSLQALAFVSRRLFAESVALIFAMRTPSASTLAGVPRLALRGLDSAHAAELLATVSPVQLDARVRDRVIAESRGNPLALTELPKHWTHAELASGLLTPASGGLTSQVEEAFAQRWTLLPRDSQRLLLIAAAEPFADTAVIWSAAVSLGIDSFAAEPAVAAGLCSSAAEVRFRHPLVRSAIYRAASAQDRRWAHRTLADITSAEIDPDRQVWHVARAVDEPDEVIASRLEDAARRALARGAPAAAAAFQRTAVSLTSAPLLRSRRWLLVAEAELLSGNYDGARAAAGAAEHSTNTESTRRHAALTRARVSFAASRSNSAVPGLLAAARRVALIDPQLARLTYLEAFSAALFASCLAAEGGDVTTVARDAHALRRPHIDAPLDQLLHALSAALTEPSEHPAELIRVALDAMTGVSRSDPQVLQPLWVAGVTAASLWDHRRWLEISTLHLDIARDLGALSELSIALVSRQGPLIFVGDLAGASMLSREAVVATEATAGEAVPYNQIVLAAWTGDETLVASLTKAHLKPAEERGEGAGVALIEWTRALLGNSLGRYEDALDSSRRAAAMRNPFDSGSVWGAVELVEAAARTGRATEAVAALDVVVASTQSAGTDWARGVEARCRALTSGGDGTEELFNEALVRLTRAGLHAEANRAHLLCGEWLRRARRIGEAREHLRTAHENFSRMGARAFAARAARELRATGTTVAVRTDVDRGLTPQEEQIARLAAEGLSNPEIAGRLFISPRTVEYHLHKVFAKLEIASRTGLRGRFSDVHSPG
jgi:DNA-binding NarL/FixJ family response regulator